MRQVEAMALVCERLEEVDGLAEGRLRFEIQVETPQSILAADGTANLLPVGGTEAVHATAGGVLDEPATAQALAGFLARGLDCGALTEAEVTGHTGLDRAAVDQFARRSGRG